MLAKLILSLPHAWKDSIRHFFRSDSYEFHEYQPDISLSCMSSNVELPLVFSEKKAFYNLHSYAQVSDDDYISSRVWNDLLNLDEKPPFSKIYCKPVTKRDGDIQWRILHGALASCRRLRRMGYRETDSCPFCGESEDIAHVFVYCAKLKILSLHVVAVLMFDKDNTPGVVVRIP